MGRKKSTEGGLTVSMNGKELKGLSKKLNEMNGSETPTLAVTEAALNDDLCNYKYDIIDGKSAGFDHAVTGKGLIDEDLRDAFRSLNVHLAVIDDIYRHKGVEIESISTMHNDELAMLYNVTGFKIKGGEDNESIILI